MATHLSHVWIGVFDDDAPDDDFEEHDNQDDEDAPLNQFAADQGETWYDHDRVEFSFVDITEAKDVRSLVVGRSYSDDYVDAVVAKAAALDITAINVFVLAEQDEIDHPRSVARAGLRLEFLGEFSCNT